MSVMRVIPAETFDKLIDVLERLLVSHQLVYEKLLVHEAKESDVLRIPPTPHARMIVVREAREVLAKVRGEW